MGPTLGVNYDVILALRSQIFERLREKFDGDAVGYLQSARSGKKDNKVFFSYRNA